MPRIQSNITERDGERNLFLFVEGVLEPHIAHSSHPPFDKIVAEVDRLKYKQTVYDQNHGYEQERWYPNVGAVELPTDEEIENLVDLFSPVKAITRRFQRTSFDRLTIRDGRIYLDGDEATNALTDQIMRFIEDGEDFDPLVRFYEKLLSNTDDRNPEAAEHSRHQLYRWLASNRFAITPDGDILAYKGVDRWTKPTGDHPWADIEAEFCSTRSGPAIVDGVEGVGNVPQVPGGIIEMERSAVTFNPDIACAGGLHVAHYDYAATGPMGGVAVLEIVINPRDVVSITHDYGDSKMRVCRYRVLGVAHGERTDAVVLPVPQPEPTPEVEAPTEPVPTPDVDDLCYECEEHTDDCRCDEYEWEDYDADDEPQPADVFTQPQQKPELWNRPDGNPQPDAKPKPIDKLKNFLRGSGRAY